MAFSAHKKEEQMEEHHDEPEVLERKCQELATLILNSKHMVASTGAGISTSAGIPDFRGPDGVWTMAAKGKTPTKRSVITTKAVPTPTHMALVSLMDAGYLKHLISQNVDGLHRRSGIPPQSLSELHGNTNLERCTQCGKEYLRDFGISGGSSHITGRTCSVPGCGGALKDTIINFGESLPPKEIQRGYEESMSADLHLVLGTSLTVRPANDLPRSTARNDIGGKLVIVNLQNTPLDDLANVRIYGTCDVVLKRVLEILHERTSDQQEQEGKGKIAAVPPPFELKRQVAVWKMKDDCGQCFVMVNGVDSDATPYSLFKTTTVTSVNDKPLTNCPTSTEEPHMFSTGCLDGVDITLNLQGYGNYEEPSLEVSLGGTKERMGYAINFTPGLDSEWKVEQLPDDVVTSWDLLSKPATSTTDDQNEQSANTETNKLKRNKKQAKAKEPEDLFDVSKWHAVQPNYNCPHLVEEHIEMFTEGSKVSLKQPCVDCGNVGENMLCLKCHTTHCGRHVNGHMVEHNKECKNHCLVAGLIDLAIWCYKCDAYIDPYNQKLFDHYAVLHTAKFGAPPPAAAKRIRRAE